ncbi:cytochrome P450 2F2-like [Styela clava]
MYFTISLIVIAVIFLFLDYRKRKKDHPPGPWGLPILGYLPFFHEDQFITFKKLVEEYGSIFSIKIATKEVIVVNDYDLIKEALVKQYKIFSGRPKSRFFEELCNGNGFAFVDGLKHSVFRNFGINAINEFRMTSGTSVIKEEIDHMFQFIKEKKNKQVNCEDLIHKAIANAAFCLVYGERSSYDDPEFNAIYKCTKQNGNDPFIPLVTFAYWARFLPPLNGRYKKFLANFHYEETSIRRKKEERKKQPEIRGTYSNYIDKFLDKMQSENQTELFNEEQLVQNAHEIYGASIDTTSNAICWCILGLLHCPEYQDRMWREINGVIGSNTLNTEHRKEMPFTEAYIEEVLRFRPIIPLSLRRTIESTNLGRYRLPKDSTVAINIWAVHHDPKYFKNPYDFKPERFIDSNNRFVHCDKVIAFSTGPRFCPGKRLALKNIFLVLVSIVQKYKMSPPDKKSLPSFDEGIYGAVHGPHAFEVVFEER